MLSFSFFLFLFFLSLLPSFFAFNHLCYHLSRCAAGAGPPINVSRAFAAQVQCLSPGEVFSLVQQATPLRVGPSGNLECNVEPCQVPDLDCAARQCMGKPDCSLSTDDPLVAQQFVDCGFGNQCLRTDFYRFQLICEDNSIASVNFRSRTFCYQNPDGTYEPGCWAFTPGKYFFTFAVPAPYDVMNPLPLPQAPPIFPAWSDDGVSHNNTVRCGVRRTSRFGDAIGCSGNVDPFRLGSAGPVGSTCVGNGVYFLIPNSMGYRSHQFSFHFGFLEPQGSIGAVFHYQDPSNYYLWVWNADNTVPCMGVFRRKNGQLIELLTNNSDGGSMLQPSTQRWAASGLRQEMGRKTPVVNRFYAAHFIVENRDANNLEISVALQEISSDNAQHYVVMSTFDSDSPLSVGATGVWVRSANVDIFEMGVRHHRQDNLPAYCGDGTCQAERFEDCLNCPRDCSMPCTCGDGFCSGDNEVRSCPTDCGTLALRPATLEPLWPTIEQKQFVCPFKRLKEFQDGPGVYRWKFDNSINFVTQHQIAFFFQFNDPNKPLTDYQGHGMDLKMIGGGDARNLFQSSANGGCGNGREATGKGCIRTVDDPSSPLTLANPNMAAGGFPVRDCGFSIAFWAKVDSYNGNTGLVISWGDQNPAARLERVSVEVCRQGLGAAGACPQSSVTFNRGNSRISAPVAWEQGFHFIVATYDGEQLQIVVDNFTEKSVQLQSICNPKPKARITYGQLIIGAFNGYLDDLRLQVVPILRSSIGQLMTLTEVSALSPPTPFPGVNSSQPPTQRPPSPSGRFTNPPAAMDSGKPVDGNSCPNFDCDQCIYRSDSCDWCVDRCIDKNWLCEAGRARDVTKCYPLSGAQTMNCHNSKWMLVIIMVVMMFFVVEF